MYYLRFCIWNLLWRTDVFRECRCKMNCFRPTLSTCCFKTWWNHALLLCLFLQWPFHPVYKYLHSIFHDLFWCNWRGHPKFLALVRTFVISCFVALSYLRSRILPIYSAWQLLNCVHSRASIDSYELLKRGFVSCDFHSSQSLQVVGFTLECC